MSFLLRSFVTTCLCLTGGVLGCTEHERPPYFARNASETAEGTGSLGVDLTLSNRAVVADVEVEIRGTALDVPITRTIPVAPDAATAQAQFGSLVPGSYVIELSAVSTAGDTTCTGSATFSIIEDETVGVVVPLTCRGANDTGGVIVDVELNACPTLEFFFVAPLTTPVGSQLYVEAAFVDPDGDPISYDWTSAEGSFSEPRAAVTSYDCDEPGLQTLALTTNDGGDCEQTMLLQVACFLTTFRTCVPGESQTIAPSRFQDRECASCPPGSYSTIENAANCVPWTPCVAGLEEVLPGTATSDRECSSP